LPSIIYKAGRLERTESNIIARFLLSQKWPLLECLNGAIGLEPGQSSRYVCTVIFNIFLYNATPKH